MRVIGAEVHTVGDLKNALSGTDPNTVIDWYAVDSEGDSVPMTGTITVDVSPASASIELGQR